MAMKEEMVSKLENVILKNETAENWHFDRARFHPVCLVQLQF